MTDPIADMLTRMRNSLAINKSEVVLPFSKMKLGIMEIFKKEGYIKDVLIVDNELNKSYKNIKIVLKYKKPGSPAIINLKKISKPGKRVYVNYNKLPNVLNGLGLAIISTSQGLMTNKEARKRKLGGEVICEIY